MDNEEDFKAYVVARQRALLRTGWLLTGSWASAEDLVQTALMKTWPHWRRVGGGPGADAYVRRVMVNQVTDWRRRRWTDELPTETLPEQARQTDSDRDLSVVLGQAVLDLPPRQRAVVVLRFLDDVSEADTAAALGCSIGTVKSQTSKALTKLRSHPHLLDLDISGSMR